MLTPHRGAFATVGLVCLVATALAVGTAADAASATASSHRHLRPMNSVLNQLAASLSEEMESSAATVFEALGIEEGYWKPTLTATPDGSCSDSVGDEVMMYLTKYLSEALPDLAKAATRGSEYLAQVSEVVTREEMMHVLEMMGEVRTGGLGLGWGLQLVCDNKMVVSFGSGGGGGTANSVGTFSYGMGGGAQASGGLSVGGGGGCTSLDKCGAQADAGAASNLVDMREAVAKACGRASDVSVCYGGGGGGGVSAVGKSCVAGGGFSVAGKMLVRGQDGCAAAGGQSAAGNAARECSSQCLSNPNFNGCFCPCFKASAGPWAAAINCSK